MIRIMDAITEQKLGESADLDKAWAILAELVEEANEHNRPLKWYLFDTEKGEIIL